MSPREKSWMFRPLDDASLGQCVPWTEHPLVNASLERDVASITDVSRSWTTSRYFSLLYTIPSGCRVDVSPTDVSPTENSWMLRPLNKASLGYCVPDRCVPTLDRVKHGTSSVGRYHGLCRPPAPNGSEGRLAGFAPYAPDQVYWIGAPPSDAHLAHT